jgi:uncharacterized repeat protein (TIGR02543 family)
MLAIFSCTNPIIERLYNTVEKPPTLIITPDVTYTVTFDSNGGSTVENQSVAKNDTATSPDFPTKSGFSFVNWYDNVGLAEPYYDFDTPVTDHITLYARWSQIFHTVIFDRNDGSPVDSQTVAEGGLVNRPSQNPVRPGYVFDDWYSDPNLTDLYGFNTPIISRIVLYAKWTPVYTVIFESNGGSPVDNQPVIEGGMVTRPNNPTRNDFGFVNWYDNESLSGPIYDFNTPVTGGITLYARWSQIFFTVSFDSNGGSTVDNQTVGKNGTVSRPSQNPTRTGYVFDNWYSDSGLTALYGFNTPVNNDITLYAKWLPNSIAFILSFEEIVDQAPKLEDITIYRSGGQTTATINLSNPGQYTSIRWYYNDILLGESSSITLSASDIRYNMVGTKLLTLEVFKGVIPYSTSISFTVEE